MYPPLQTFKVDFQVIVTLEFYDVPAPCKFKDGFQVTVAFELGDVPLLHNRKLKVRFQVRVTFDWQNPPAPWGNCFADFKIKATLNPWVMYTPTPQQDFLACFKVKATL